MQLNNVLFSIFTSEYPNESSGGPNNIIYKIIKNSSSKYFEFDYLSSDLFVQNVTNENLLKLPKERTNKKKIAAYLAENSPTGYLRRLFSGFYRLCTGTTITQCFDAA
jgi:hypothetical protein